MKHFFGILAAADTPADRARAVCSQMARTFDGANWRCSDIHQIDRLFVSFASAASIPPASAAQTEIVRAEGLSVFGDVTLFNQSAGTGSDGSPPVADKHLVALHKYLRAGGDAAKLNGEFAFGAYDEQTRRLTLVRDQIGTRIAYYARRPEGLAFSSWIQPLFETGIDRTALDRQALASYLALFFPGGGKTYFPEISELDAAHSVRAGPDGRIEKRRYWVPETNSGPGFRDDRDWIDHIREELIRAVRQRASGAERIGVQLSGGLDSSTVAGILCSEFPEREITGYFLQPALSYPDLSDDDAPYVTAVQDRWPNLTVKPVSSEGQDVLAGPEHWYATAGSPCIDAFQYAEDTLAVAARAERVDLMMTGEGGDDTISTYPGPYLAEMALSLNLRRLLAEFGRLKANEGRSFLRVLRGLLLPPFVPAGAKNVYRRLAGRPWHDELAVHPDLIADPAFRNHLKDCGFHALNNTPLSLSGQIRSVFSSTMPPFYAFAEAQSAGGYRVRNPLLDIELVQSVCAAPARLFVSEGQDRALIRAVAGPYLPSIVRDRPGKAPFIPDYFARLAPALPHLQEAFRRFRSNDTWMAVCDVAKPGRVLSQFRADTNREADYNLMIQHVIFPYYLGRFLELVAAET